MSSVTVRFIGSGPYCYANSLAMMLGSAAPEPAVIEVLTGSPFGAGLLGGVTPFFNPPGWDPGIGLDTAIGLLGWTCRHGAGGSGTEAAVRLGEASESRLLLAGPLEFGLLLHHPDSGTAIGSDHYVVVTGVEDGIVRFHDPPVIPTRRCRRTISSPRGGPTRSAMPPSRSPPGLALTGPRRRPGHRTAPGPADGGALARRGGGRGGAPRLARRRGGGRRPRRAGGNRPGTLAARSPWLL